MCIVEGAKGSFVSYSKTPLVLSDNTQVLYKIEAINRPEEVSDDEMKGLLKDVENKINWKILKELNVNSLPCQYPHLYFEDSLMNNKDFEFMAKFFVMSHVPKLQIMLYPGNNKELHLVK